MEFKINFLKAARGDWLRAVVHVLKPGRTLSIVSCRVSIGDDGAFSPCAQTLGTMFLKENQDTASAAEPA